VEHAQAVWFISECAFHKDTNIGKIAVDPQVFQDLLQIQALTDTGIDLDRVLAADRDRVLVISFEELESTMGTTGAIGVLGAAQIDSAALPFPQVKLQQSSHRSLLVAHEDLEGLAGLV